MVVVENMVKVSNIKIHHTISDEIANWLGTQAGVVGVRRLPDQVEIDLDPNLTTAQVTTIRQNIMNKVVESVQQ